MGDYGGMPDAYFVLKDFGLSMVSSVAMFFGWSAIGIIFYYAYGYRRSHLANGTEAAN